MKILYKPFALIGGLIGARVAKVIFRGLWSRVDDSDPPKPTTAGASFGKVVGAAAMEAATMAAVGAAVDRAGARTFQHLTGIWPGDKPEPKDDK
jgi:Protein of unknown function (DUF4235)